MNVSASQQHVTSLQDIKANTSTRFLIIHKNFPNLNTL